jgi:hypothetical protein
MNFLFAHMDITMFQSAASSAPAPGHVAVPPKKDAKHRSNASTRKKSWEERREELLAGLSLRAARNLNKMFPPPEAPPAPVPRKAAKKKSRNDDGVYRPETSHSSAGKKAGSARPGSARPALARNAKAIAEIMIADHVEREED